MPNILASLEAGKSSIMTNQVGMDTTGHNMANVHTKGFSRQRVEIGTMWPDDIQPGQIGRGVLVQRVVRIYDQFLEQSLRKERTSKAEWSITHDYQRQVEIALAEPSEFGLNSRTSKFFNAWQDLSEYPEDYGLRSLVRDAGQDMNNTFNLLKSDISGMRQNVDDRIVNKVSRVNNIIDEIADLNKKILSIEVAGNDPNDLKDNRDKLITELAENFDIKVQNLSSGLKVTLGNMLLVEGGVTNLLATSANPLNDNMNDVTFGGSVINFDTIATGSKGEIGALLNFRDNVITGYDIKITDYMLGLAHNVNDEHFSGFSYDSALTNFNFFEMTDAANSDLEMHTSRSGLLRVQDLTNMQAGSHHLTVALDPAGGMTANTGGDISAAAGDGGMVTLNSAGAYTGTTVSEFYVEVVSGNAAAGDLNGMQVQLMKDGTAVSGVFTLAAGAGPQNIAFGVFDGVTFDANITAAGGEQFTTADRSHGIDTDATASLDGGPAQTLTTNANLIFTGGANNNFTAGGTMRLVFGGTITPGSDTITTYSLDSKLAIDTDIMSSVNNIAAANNATSAGDNTNTLDIANLQFQSLLANSTQSFSQFYNEFVTSVGSDTTEANRWETNQEVIVAQLEEERESYSGVNMDEELTNMIKFQRGFESASRFITTIDGMIDVIINRMGYVGR